MDFIIPYRKILGDTKYKGAKVEYVLKCEQGPWVQYLTQEIKTQEQHQFTDIILNNFQMKYKDKLLEQISFT